MGFTMLNIFVFQNKISPWRLWRGYIYSFLCGHDSFYVKNPIQNDKYMGFQMLNIAMLWSKNPDIFVCHNAILNNI